MYNHDVRSGHRGNLQGHLSGFLRVWGMLRITQTYRGLAEGAKHLERETSTMLVTTSLLLMLYRIYKHRFEHLRVALPHGRNLQVHACCGHSNNLQMLQYAVEFMCIPMKLENSVLEEDPEAASVLT